MKVIISGTKEQIDDRYDALFKRIKGESFMPGWANSSQKEYDDGDKYVVEMKSLSSSVLLWVEETEGYEVG